MINIGKCKWGKMERIRREEGMEEEAFFRLMKQMKNWVQFSFEQLI